MHRFRELLDFAQDPEKIVTIPWKKSMKKSGDYGHHFDNVKMEFIRDYVAPLLMGKTEAALPE